MANGQGIGWKKEIGPERAAFLLINNGRCIGAESLDGVIIVLFFLFFFWRRSDFREGERQVLQMWNPFPKRPEAIGCGISFEV